MLHNRLIDHDNVNGIFSSLADNYSRLGGTLPVNIYVVGGTAILLNFTFRESTIDVDAYFKANDLLSKAMLASSEELLLPKDWLNQDFVNTPSFNKRMIKRFVLIRRFGDLINVFSLPPEYQIAMKLKSSRPTSGDLDDVIKMIYELRYRGVEITYDEIIAAYNDLYPDTSNTYQYFFDEARKALDVPIEDFEYLFKATF